MGSVRSSVTAADLRAAADQSNGVLTALADRDWAVNAYHLRWTCRRTLDHMLNCLAWYAHDLASELTEEAGAARAGTPRLPLGHLIFSVRSLAEVLAIVGESKQATARGWHNWGVGDPEGFLAMGAIEMSLHTWDIVMALDPVRAGDAIVPEVAEHLVGRLFPGAPTGSGPVPTLLHVTGRGDLPGLDRVRKWEWHTAPVD